MTLVDRSERGGSLLAPWRIAADPAISITYAGHTYIVSMDPILPYVLAT